MSRMWATMPGTWVGRQSCEHERVAPARGVGGFVMPTTVEEVEKLSWGQLLYLAGENAEALGINGTATTPLQP